MSRRAYQGEKVDPAEARERAETLRAAPHVRAWMRRFRKLMREQPEGTWIYWQEDDMNLMALSPDGEKYIEGDGSDQAAIIDSQTVPGSDSGAW